MTALLAQTADPTHGLPALREWMVWGPLGVLFGVVLLMSLTYFFGVTLPGKKREQLRLEREAEARSAAMTQIGEATASLAVSHGQQTQLLGTVVETQRDHGERLLEHGNLLKQLAGGQRCPPG